MKILIVIQPENVFKTAGLSASSLANFKEARDWEIWFVNNAKTRGSIEALRNQMTQDELDRTRFVTPPFPFGPGGIQKVVFRHARENGFDAVAVFEDLEGNFSQVMDLFLQQATSHSGDRTGLLIQHRNAFDRLYEWALNKISGINIGGWLARYRFYWMASLDKVAFEFNTVESHFDTEILLQLADQGETMRVLSPSFPLRRAGAGFRRVVNDLKSCLKFRLQKFSFLYDVRFHPELLHDNLSKKDHSKHYDSKFDDRSPHSFVQNEAGLIKPGAKVLDIGCSTGYVSRSLAAQKNCAVVGVDRLPQNEVDQGNFEYIQIDLETGARQVADLVQNGRFDIVMMLDVLEHLSNPEFFLMEIFKRKYEQSPLFLFSTGNVAFIGVRGMLLLGYFNYGERGILDITHKRLFSYRTFKNLIEQTGFCIQKRHFFPVPFRKLGLSAKTSHFLDNFNLFLIRLFPTLFSYQILFEARLLTSPAAADVKITNVR